VFDPLVPHLFQGITGYIALHNEYARQRRHIFAFLGKFDVAAQGLRRGRPEKAVVPGGGFEPPTRGFSIRCSTN
jgi:hypothetical protein